jgi:hypothetical protein
MRDPFIDSLFGKLTWNARVGWWFGEVALTPKHTIEVYIVDEPDHTLTSPSTASASTNTATDWTLD